jgi:hypothetical protein
LGEAGGMNLNGFVGNDSVNTIDLLGLVIECNCPEKYFDDNGLKGMYIGNGNSYSAKPGGSGPTSGTGLILWRMLLTSHKFTAAGLNVEELKNHVEARQTIVNNALKANFKFGTGQTLDISKFKPGADIQAYFNSLNNGKTELACKALSELIFETGNKFKGMGARNRDNVWIPGDWGYIRNEAYKDPSNWIDPETGRDRGEQGENVFHTGVDARGDLFWGHSRHGLHPSKSEKEWWHEILNDWHKGNDGQNPKPVWRDRIIYPKNGLQ